MSKTLFHGPHTLKMAELPRQKRQMLCSLYYVDARYH